MQGSTQRPRALLTQANAIEIFQKRKQNIEPQRFKTASELAVLFKVSPKTIRDIWNRRTWIRETNHLWCTGEKPQSRLKTIQSIRQNEISASKFYIDGVKLTTRNSQPAGPPSLDHEQPIPMQTCQFAAHNCLHPICAASRLCLCKVFPPDSNQTLPCHKSPIPIFQTQPGEPGDASSAAAAWMSAGICNMEVDPFRHDWPYW